MIAQCTGVCNGAGPAFLPMPNRAMYGNWTEATELTTCVKLLQPANATRQCTAGASGLLLQTAAEVWAMRDEGMRCGSNGVIGQEDGVVDVGCPAAKVKVIKERFGIVAVVDAPHWRARRTVLLAGRLRGSGQGRLVM